jgi:hypothetical protein
MAQPSIMINLAKQASPQSQGQKKKKKQKPPKPQHLKSNNQKLPRKMAKAKKANNARAGDHLSVRDSCIKKYPLLH